MSLLSNQRVLIIAELSANHNHSYERAVELVQAAKAAGADAVKLQTYTADTITVKSDRPEFLIHGGLWDGRQLHDLYQEAYTPWEWQPKLKEVAESLGMPLFSTPFDHTAVDFLEAMDVPAYKIASFELVDIPLIRRVAATGKPLIMSTGMASIDEIDDAVTAARDAGAKEIALLKCTSAYPALPEDANLLTIPNLATRFGVIPGLSDHTLGTTVPIAAVTLGARVIEKHFTLARSDGGPDGAFSLEPAEFREMVDAVRIAEKALGEVSYRRSAAEEGSLKFRRSLYVVKDVKAGETITTQNVRSIRPADGLSPKHWDTVMGRTLSVDVPANTPLDWSMISS
ncbi:pseudaminic acid synthase [Rubinisphaera margarita]|uniref:pseudaminic acid synthase n=1 Tax=Rubinisphaera margarita TaxID=2909586 RepID=UPI001EE7A72D|nr:pseudaminic acid synthase [Rubinisphaera margarita]MCG6157321.1 pseudaminic acid synthase [Rubinisphaera margarita]